MLVELGALALEPCVPQEREQRVAEGRRPDLRPALERNGQAESRERCIEREPDPVDGRTDDGDLVRRDSSADQSKDVLGDELERSPDTGSLEKPNRRVERGARGIVGEERSLEMRKGLWEELARPRRELGHVVAGERREVVGGSPEGGVRSAPRLVRQRHVNLGARRERLEQPPFRPGQVLEPVGEDRTRVPGGEIARESVDRVPAQRAAIPCVESFELAAKRRRERAQRFLQVTGLEQSAIELAERATNCVRVPGEAGDLARHHLGELSHEQRALDVPDDALSCAIRERECLEQRVERPDRPGEQSTATRDELELDPLDIRAVRDDQPGILVKRVDEPIEQPLDLPGVRRPDDEGEPHWGMVVGCISRPGLRPGPGNARNPHGAERTTQASDFGLRPRLATAAPGIEPAHGSHKSAALAPRRASLNVTRITAPLPSSTSVPHLSQTSTVFRATIPSIQRNPWRDFHESFDRCIENDTRNAGA